MTEENPMTEQLSELKSTIQSYADRQRELRAEAHRRSGMERHACNLDRRSWRPTIRELLLTYAFLRGRSYAQVERHGSVPQVDLASFAQAASSYGRPTQPDEVRAWFAARDNAPEEAGLDVAAE
jgi:hypothetical protein